MADKKHWLREAEVVMSDIDPELRRVPRENWQDYLDIKDAQALGYPCPRCGATQFISHWSGCSIYKSQKPVTTIGEPSLIEQHLAITGGPSEERSDEWVEAQFTEADANYLRYERDLLLTVQETEVSPAVAEVCQAELREAEKAAWKFTRKSAKTLKEKPENSRRSLRR